MSRHIVGNGLMVFTHLACNFLLNVSDEFNGGRDIALTCNIEIIGLSIVIMTIFGRKFMSDDSFEGVFNLQ